MLACFDKDTETMSNNANSLKLACIGIDKDTKTTFKNAKKSIF